ncbi:hypothetical protein CHUAL_001464 [Chamberlinius hualienensis]
MDKQELPIQKIFCQSHFHLNIPTSTEDEFETTNCLAINSSVKFSDCNEYSYEMIDSSIQVLLKLREVEIPEIESPQERLQNVRPHMKLLVHTILCRAQSNGPCHWNMCRAMNTILHHSHFCNLTTNCPFPHCSSTRRLLDHWLSCEDNECNICSILKDDSRVL